MKKISFIMVCIMVLLLNIPAGYSADNIAESPKTRVIIDGKQQSFSNAPLSVNNRTMLPLREILTNIGVLNENIIWSDSEKSVTAYKDDVKIHLKVGSTTAYINDNAFELDAAPVNYKNRVFIPVRFVSASLGKKVIWDEGTKSVLIREEKEFGKTKEVLEKIKSAVSTVKKYKFQTEADMVVAAKAFEMKGEGAVDLEQETMLMNMGVVVAEREIKTENIFAHNAVFTRISPAAQWQKKSLNEEQYKKLLNNQLLISDKMDVLAAGLVIQPETGMNELVMKGDVFMDDIFQQSAEAISIFGIEFNKMHMEICADNSSYLLRRVEANMDGSVKSASASQSVTERINCTYSDYNGEFEIALPQEIK